MAQFCRVIVVSFVAGALLGCTTQGNPLHGKPLFPMDATGPKSPRTAQRPPQNTKTAYRRELLNNQLRNAQMDLQSASTESEKVSVQERIDVIQHMLDTLDGPGRQAQRMSDRSMQNFQE